MDSDTREFIAIYCRISNDKHGTGLGVERQLAECSQLARELGVPRQHRVYVDNDVSATTGVRRPEFEQLLADLRQGVISHLITWHVDRLYRLPSDLERILAALNQQPGVRVHTVTSGVLDLDTPAGRMGAGLYASVARYEVEQKQIRQRAQTMDLARKGLPKPGGLRPFGYEQDGVTVREAEAEVIRDATARLLRGESALNLVRVWNAAGIKTVRGHAERGDKATAGTWTPSSLQSMLTRWRNAGVRQHRGEPIGDAQWPAIVTREDLELLRRRFSDPQRRTASDTTRRHLLSFLMTCERCGGRLRAAQTSSRGRTYPVYQCPGLAGCRLAIHYEVAEHVVRTYLMDRLLTPDVGLLAATAEHREALDKGRAAYDELLRDAEVVETANVSAGRKMRQLALLEEEQRTLSLQISSLRNRLALADLVIDQRTYVVEGRADINLAAAARRQALVRFDALDLHQRRTILKALCRISVKPATPGIRHTKTTGARRLVIVPLDFQTGEPIRVQGGDA